MAASGKVSSLGPHARADIHGRLEAYRALHGCDPEIMVLSSAEWQIAIQTIRENGLPDGRLLFDGVTACCFERTPEPVHIEARDWASTGWRNKDK